MDKKIKWLVLPDVHARDFWQEPVKEVLQETDANIIFLGDYLDPYPDEWEDGEDYRRIAIERFKEIIQLKKDNPNRITLLLGNHDCGYAIGPDICTTRMDYANYQEIANLFESNRELFQIAEETEINGKHIIFSHAGIFKGWCHRAFGKLADKENFNPVNVLNNGWLTEDGNLMLKLGIYDNYRGYGGAIYGSPIWADIRAWGGATMKDTYGFNIVGHTQLEFSPIMNSVIMDLDCRRAFYIDDQGEIRDYETDKVIEIPEDE